ncbi:NmrA-like family protein [Mollisia scopiformis]|uniref:NmrA-like family protein n=1 Tax=Mollisia scopiformis TaxID=149040 RepID=A0A194WTV4_MOLSC|nr:NmrA-like family protein [Mollisia scopiformis]KUJ11385.1 NmrA-like family protein [Mollisia scopiformis]
MSNIKNVAVIGGSGNLGPSVIEALLDAGFEVTALTRAESKATFPASVKVQKVDYSSSTSVAEALKGQDAVVSTIATLALSQQSSLVEEAVKAGVKRFIPSEFGLNTPKVTGGTAKILGAKLQLQEQLKKLAAENPSFSWTGVSTSLFFDWGLKVGSLGFNVKDKTATIFDSGNEPFTGSNLPFIGQSVAAILKHPEQTANKYIQVASFTTTQNEILKLLEEESGTKWTVDHKKTEDFQKIADEKLAKGDYSSFGDYLKVYLFADGKGQSPKEGELANKELGLKTEDLKATIKSVL